MLDKLKFHELPGRSTSKLNGSSLFARSTQDAYRTFGGCASLSTLQNLGFDIYFTQPEVSKGEAG